MLEERAKKKNKFLKAKLKVALLDADGTFYDGYETMGASDGKVTIFKRRHFHDGQAISFLRALGIRVLFISGEGEPLNNHIEKFNNLPSVKSGDWEKIELATKVSGQGKVEAINDWLEKNDFSWSECLYMGDDVNDLEAMEKVKKEGGVVVAPANATRKVKEVADHITEKRGGHGAIRELAEMVLDARGVDESTLLSS